MLQPRKFVSWKDIILAVAMFVLPKHYTFAHQDNHIFLHTLLFFLLFLQTFVNP